MIDDLLEKIDRLEREDKINKSEIYGIIQTLEEIKNDLENKIENLEIKLQDMAKLMIRYIDINTIKR